MARWPAAAIPVPWSSRFALTLLAWRRCHASRAEGRASCGGARGHDVPPSRSAASPAAGAGGPRGPCPSRVGDAGQPPRAAARLRDAGRSLRQVTCPAPPHLLPDDWKGGFVLLVGVFVLSGFLDNIAAAMIGGTRPHACSAARCNIGYLAAIVAASNAGGAGSVVGDTTTTMMWIAGARCGCWRPSSVGAVALVFFGVIAAGQQHATSRSRRRHAGRARRRRPAQVVGLHPRRRRDGHEPLVQPEPTRAAGSFPRSSARPCCWRCSPARWRAPAWSLLPGAFKGSVFLLALVWCASLMPVEKLPARPGPPRPGARFRRSVFDNIPLTALAIRQDG